MHLHSLSKLRMLEREREGELEELKGGVTNGNGGGNEVVEEENVQVLIKL